MQKTKKEPVRGKRAGTPGGGTQAYLQVRLWAGSGRADDDVPVGALAMVEDFLGVSPCEPFELGRMAVCGVFPDLVQAVNAGRRLQRMVRGYARAANGGLGAGMLLTSGDETVSDAEMNDLRQTQALSLAQPGQLFVVGSLCDTVRSIPGLQFKEIDSGFANGADGRPRRAVLVVPAAEESGSAAGEEMKTRVVESFVRTPAQENGVYDLKAMPLVLAPLGAKPDGAAAVPRKSVSESEVPPASPLWARAPVRWAIGVGAALAALAAVAMGVHGRSSGGKDAQGSATPAIVAAPSVPATAAAGGDANPPAKSDSGKGRKRAEEGAAPKPNEGLRAPLSTGSGATETAKKADVEPKPEVAKREPVAPAPPAETKPREKYSAGGVSVSYSAEDIGNLLAHADKQSGDGNYDQAIREYKSVLSHDPGNARAKQGLERAMHNKGGG